MGAVIHSFDRQDALYVAERMRACDREEIYATRYGEDPAELINDMAQCADFAWIAKVDGEPVAIVGARPMWPNVWCAFAFGTDKWRSAILTVTKHIRRFMIPGLLTHGAHTCVAFSHAGHREAHAWMISLGAHAEHRLQSWGRGREDFILFAWRR